MNNKRNILKSYAGFIILTIVVIAIGAIGALIGGAKGSVAFLTGVTMMKAVTGIIFFSALVMTIVELRKQRMKRAEEDAKLIAQGKTPEEKISIMEKLETIRIEGELEKIKSSYKRKEASIATFFIWLKALIIVTLFLVFGAVDVFILRGIVKYLYYTPDTSIQSVLALIQKNPEAFKYIAYFIAIQFFMFSRGFGTRNMIDAIERLSKINFFKKDEQNKTEKEDKNPDHKG
ncbi:hypothetical protein [Candidatus Deianiraea vastatrix]|uniref:DUF106 domain-containing protein n=1 Tax=Candidatus Deianiraea vastatrix TaxID=2163644 RepID=A0A5B8XG03_9RICK|nr:hypothetical protein [Candidatus Deianiraea vastatrix]QED23839.1 hypothetical protein Deia_01057 [Candidatus Deianiraea vastatrix]